MYSTIMIPVDLRHADQLEKAIATAADIAKLYGAQPHIVGVGQSLPTAVARTPAEYADKLAAYADKCSAANGIDFTAHVKTSHDPSIDLDVILQKAGNEIGADLIVMASHVPKFAEHIFASNAGYLASHSSSSIFVVR
ncbi:universal stress protein [Pararhodobacter oceanensis]|uniref:Universal stress protein UspA n=1 Tax=Pararhodobacter oceanensis TaxID=2172121 RepID=A0A2T8HPD4_9RHOB|nr:universal stress protein [Pararhodobacter oceanensis]PVH27297.1 universal stress protein UspA [Pararhodobacter oceanensis]